MKVQVRITNNGPVGGFTTEIKKDDKWNRVNKWIGGGIVIPGIDHPTVAPAVHQVVAVLEKWVETGKADKAAAWAWAWVAAAWAAAAAAWAAEAAAAARAEAARAAEAAARAAAEAAAEYVAQSEKLLELLAAA